MSVEIFENETANAVKTGLLKGNGILQVDISGVLDGADVITYIKDTFGNLIVVRDCSWMSSKGDTLDSGDGALKFLEMREVQFSIINAGASTDISLSVTHEPGIIINP